MYGELLHLPDGAVPFADFPAQELPKRDLDVSGLAFGEPNNPPDFGGAVEDPSAGDFDLDGVVFKTKSGSPGFGGASGEQKAAGFPGKKLKPFPDGDLENPVVPFEDSCVAKSPLLGGAVRKGTFRGSLSGTDRPKPTMVESLPPWLVFFASRVDVLGLSSLDNSIFLW